MANRISTLIDFDTRGGVRSLGQLRTEISNADGAANKAKTGFKGLGDVMKANLAETAAVAGTALITFAAKSVQAFQDTAIASGKFADATGLAVDQASRWVEVAGDVGVSTETVEGLFIRLNKAVGSNAPVLEEYGIQAKRTADGQVDVNATMLEAIRVIGAIEDPTKRADAAQQVFGRNYKEAAEIIFDSAENVERKLNDVSEAKVIDEEELRKAREFRRAMDDLRDRLEDIMLTVGEGVVPALTDMADSVEDIDSAARSLTGSGLGEWLGATLASGGGSPAAVAKDIGESIGLIGDEAAGAEPKAGALAEKLDAVGAAADGVEAMGEALEGVEEAAEPIPSAAEQIATEIELARTNVERFGTDGVENMGRVEEATEDVEEAFADLKAEINQRQEWRNLQNQFDRVHESAVAAYTAAADGSAEAEQAARDHQAELDTLREDVIAYHESVDGIPEGVTTNVLALIDRGRLDEAEAQLAWVARNRDVPLTIRVRGNVPGGNSYFARGTNHAPAGMAIVGEEGPELVELSGGEKIHTAAQTRQILSTGGGAVVGGGITLNVYAGMGADGGQIGRQIVEELRRHKRLGGDVSF